MNKKQNQKRKFLKRRSKRRNTKHRNTKHRNTKNRNTKRRNTKRRNTKRRNTKRRDLKYKQLKKNKLQYGGNEIMKAILKESNRRGGIVNLRLLDLDGQDYGIDVALNDSEQLIINNVNYELFLIQTLLNGRIDDNLFRHYRIDEYYRPFVRNLIRTYPEFKLIEKEKTSINRYTGNYYRDINTTLRDPSNVPTEAVRKDIDNIRSAFLKVKPIKTNLTVIRGIDYDDNIFQMHNNSGEYVVHDKSFMSSSVSLRSAYNFFKSGRTNLNGQLCCFMIINIMPGSRVLPIKFNSRFSFEEEILLPESTKLKFKKEYVFNDNNNLRAKCYEYDMEPNLIPSAPPGNLLPQVMEGIPAPPANLLPSAPPANLLHSTSSLPEMPPTSESSLGSKSNSKEDIFSNFYRDFEKAQMENRKGVLDEGKSKKQKQQNERLGFNLIKYIENPVEQITKQDWAGNVFGPGLLEGI